MTNYCLFDCAYCVNRRSSNVERARFSVEDIVWITVEFYKRNYIEGLFLSSGIIRSPDYTMEQIVRVARSLREQHGFRGYIHLKTIPEADPDLIAEAGRHADRVSINIELPTESGLSRFAPEKRAPSIRGSPCSASRPCHRKRTSCSHAIATTGAPTSRPGFAGAACWSGISRSPESRTSSALPSEPTRSATA